MEYTWIMFVWKKDDKIQSFTIDGPITYEKALERARRWGFVKARWYKPSTWGNYVVTRS